MISQLTWININVHVKSAEARPVLQITFLSCTDCTDEFLNGSVHNFFGLYIVLINF